MSDWHNYIAELGVPLYTSDDHYGFYTAFACTLTPNLAYKALDQAREYILHDEYGVEPSIRRYEDRSTRIFLTVMDLSGNEYETIEMELSTDVLEALDTIYLDEA